MPTASWPESRLFSFSEGQRIAGNQPRSGGFGLSPARKRRVKWEIYWSRVAAILLQKAESRSWLAPAHEVNCKEDY
jgi:hypothetical protein